MHLFTGMKGLVILLVMAAGTASYLAFQSPPALSYPVLFVSRQIPCCGSVYMADARALPGVGGYSKYQVAAPGFLCIWYPDGTLDTLVNGADPRPESLHLIDVSAPCLSWDATKVVFAGLPDGDYVEGNGNQIPKEHNAWRLYVIGIDGSGLKQVTGIPGKDTFPDLGQFHPLAVQGLTGYDDTDPAWLPDGRIVFSSTRFPGIAMYNVTRTSNLFVVGEDGTGLTRITSEKNGADRPVVDPFTGKIVFARWWRNFYWPYDGMESVASTQYPEGWIYHDGLTSDLNSVIDGEQYMFNNNAFALTEIRPDGSALRLFSTHFRETSTNSCYGGAFDPDGHFVGNWFPIEHSTESSGFGGVKRYFRGPAGQPEGLAGVTDYGNLDYYVSDPPSYGILKGEYAAEPFVMDDGRILFSKAQTPEQDYGIFIMNADGSDVESIFDVPGMTELRAQLVKPRPVPPVLPETFSQVPGLLPPKGVDDLKQEGTFSFDCRNIFFNAPVDVPVISAPAVGDVASVRFFAGPLRDQQYGSVEALDFPILYSELTVDDFGRVLESDAPAHVPLFEQARSSPQDGYLIPRTGGGIMDGAGQVMGFNYGRPGEKVTCVGCHHGHSMIPVPELAEDLLFTNLAPGALISASSAMNAPGWAIDRKNITAKGKHWFSAENADPNAQWLQLHWRVPVWARKVVLHGIPEGFDVDILQCRLRLFSDSSFTQEVFQEVVTGGLSDQGTEVILPGILKIRSMRLEFMECVGGIYHWDCAAIGDIEVIASQVDPVRFGEISDCKGVAYGPHQLDSCGQCLLPDDPAFNDCMTFVEEGFTSGGWWLTPNPATGTTWLHTPKSVPYTYRIFSLDGRKWADGQTQGSTTTLSVAGWPPGVYWVMVEDDAKTKILRLVVGR